jgi:type I restriction enzyme M protein
LDYDVFLAEANAVGYTPSGLPLGENDLYVSGESCSLAEDQTGTILGEYREFVRNPAVYQGRQSPDCMAISFADLWLAHESNRLDPKYHLFKRESARPVPTGWLTLPLAEVMKRREEPLVPAANEDKEFIVLTISQTGDIRPRPAGVGRNPPRWLGSYFIDSPGTWYVAHKGDIVYSSIDLWKGCLGLVPDEFDGSLVTKEFPIYEVTDKRLVPSFLQVLLRTRYYQRAFRAITTGHSNRRRTQTDDFEALSISFPEDPSEQLRLIGNIQNAVTAQQNAGATIKTEMMALSTLIDGRGQEETDTSTAYDDADTPGE